MPSLSVAIGKVSLVAVFAMAWAAGLGITDPTFATENVRLENIIGSLFALLFSTLIIPVAGPPGMLALLIPMIPSMVSAGVHPLSFYLLTGQIAIALRTRYISHKLHPETGLERRLAFCSSSGWRVSSAPNKSCSRGQAKTTACFYGSSPYRVGRESRNIESRAIQIDHGDEVWDTSLADFKIRNRIDYSGFI